MTRSVRDVIASATTVLASVGVDSPAADARWLLAHVLGVSQGRLLLVDDISDAVAKDYDDLVAARARRVPLQHLTGSASFGPVELAVGPGVFVPRPETELLYAWALEVAEGDSPTIVDLCSGSGALAIALAVSLPRARVHAVERSPIAAQWLRRNVDDAGVTDRVHVHLGDATDSAAVSAFVGGPVDLVVSNPPYVPTGVPVSQEVQADPAEAVFGGGDGMSVITPMVGVIAEILRSGGRVGIEHDDTTSASVVAVMTGSGAFDEVQEHRDLAGRPRFVTARARMDR
ncbi:MAG TPA: peptide chain release factor N(5)-glutamine methyltransferase [Gordonia polyisoprenivorans]|uniref:Release factor glutamine methyltransferase n=1 Tax=Gordonia polyisoprenivorans TaxID=84595 RepID=A0A846WVK3_9ACTN|nr:MULTISPECIES: peptide chain release factor N(5)-glutamine methyltransferase [Gordonia]MDF3285232.1 peptide chain release factor N(5)-glutamine methyltransferase [Gordonia sp. N1V]NKY04673.1 peptide chain release factor N(5)-glutamine methyltransferase [Gordonia polyisoprenivorans]OPX15956.1 protein-(glutamine-N5) methyltransferase, release factor-specific [Gordonia sp. i37]UZF58273.1 peptide chain release factor N(5)-glutamine methyltransferase [Gordonia polyisoprenivorans]WCB39308.1 peptid